MNRILIVLCFFMIFSCSQEKENDTAGAESQLMRLNDIYDNAIINKDTAVLDRIYSDEVTVVSPEGKLLNKNEQIISLFTTETRYDSAGSTDVNIKFYGNTAIMTGIFRGVGTYRGNPVSINERYTTVWAKKDTSWHVISEHGTIIQQN